MQHINIPVQFMNQILSYLAERPFKEVAHLIGEAQSIAENQRVAEEAQKQSEANG